MPAFNINIPNRAMILVSAVMSIATFDIPYLSVPDIFGDVLPDEETLFHEANNDTSPVLIENLNSIGYESHYMAPSMGSVYIFMLGTVFGLILIVILQPIKGCHPRLEKIQNWLKTFFLWNWVIRLILEAALELSFVVILQYDFLSNLKNAGGFFEGVDYLMTYLVIFGLIFLPCFILVFYCKNFDKL